MVYKLLNFGDEKYDKARRFNSFTAKKVGGFDEIISFTFDDIDEAFKSENQEIFSIKRGKGLWLWKPYLIMKVLNESNEGDIVVYSDSGMFFINKIQRLVKTLDESDIWLYGLPLIEKEFTSNLTFVSMNCNSNFYRNSNQFSGSFLMFRVSNKSKKFVQEWLKLCQNRNILEGDVSQRSNVLHREDQSILSLLAKKNNIFMHKDPTQFGKIPEKYKIPGKKFKIFRAKEIDQYKIILVHHRTPNVDFKVCINQFLCCFLPRSFSLLVIKRKV